MVDTIVRFVCQGSLKGLFKTENRNKPILRNFLDFFVDLFFDIDLSIYVYINSKNVVYLYLCMLLLKDLHYLYNRLKSFLSTNYRKKLFITIKKSKIFINDKAPRFYCERGN